jgi:hypothetical protein
VTVIMEPTRNAWVPLAAWFRRHGATVVLVPPEQAADLRAYYHKHTKTDRLDPRLPLLHADGLHAEHGLGPADVLPRATKLRATLVKRRTTTLSRLDALLELLGPGWLAAFGADLANKTPLRFLAAGCACPYTLKRLGAARAGRFLCWHSRGVWGDEHATQLLTAAEQTLALWADELDYGALADDIAVEARLVLQLTEEIHELDQRTKVVLERRDPAGIMTSAPGVGQVTGAQILGRLGDPGRFRSLAGVRSFSGLVPSLDASGVTGKHGGPTKAGDAVLRQALFIAADHARRLDPTSPRAPPAHGPRRQAPQRRPVPHRHRLADPPGGLLAPRPALRCPRQPTADPSPSPKGAAPSPSATRSPNELRDKRRTTRPARGPDGGRAGEARSRRALRHRPSTPPYRPQPGLTAIRNSTARS